MISIKPFKLICKSFQIAFLGIGLLLLFFYAQDCYLLFKANKAFLLQAESFQFIEKNFKPLADLSIQFLALLALFIYKLICLGLAYFIFNRIPVPSSFIKHWQEENEITAILGRFFVNHYRWNHYMNVKEFLYICSCASIEIYHINLHANNPNLEPLFKQFDTNYTKDKIAQ